MSNPIINLELPLQAVQYIVNTLGARPHSEVHELILAIVEQANAQTKPAEVPAEEVVAEGGTD
jgi:hypothetical protein